MARRLIADRADQTLDGAAETAAPDTRLAAAWRQRADAHGYPDPLLDLIAVRFRLLGEPLRLKLVAALSGGERSVGVLVALTGANQPNVSKHLAALARGDLVCRRKVGTTIYYALADPGILMLCDAVCTGVQQHFTAQARALGLPDTSGEGDHATATRPTTSQRDAERSERGSR